MPSQQQDIPPEEMSGPPISPVSDEVIVGSRFSNSLGNEDFAKWLESAQEILLPLYADLTGKQLQADENGALIWKRVGKAKCTDECAEFVIMRFRHLLNPNTFMSNLEDDDIRKFATSQANTFAFTLAKKADIWELDSYLQDELMEMFRLHLFAAMRRAHDGDEKKLFAAIQRVNELGMPVGGGMMGQMPQNQPGGVSGMLGSFFRR